MMESVTRYTMSADKKTFFCVECGGIDSTVEMLPVPTAYMLRCPWGHILTMYDYHQGEQ